MTLRAGSMEIGLGRSALQRITLDAGLMGLCPPQSEYWIGTCDMTHITMTISDEALMAAADGTGSRIELRLERELVDPRLRALATAVDVERIAGFPSGRLFLDSIEQALARALVVGYAGRAFPIEAFCQSDFRRASPEESRDAHILSGGRRANALRESQNPQLGFAA